MENLNLIRKLAHSFADKTNIEYDELFSEAALAYCEAKERFDPENGAKLSTFAWCHVRNMLVNYCRKETKVRDRHNFVDEFPAALHPKAPGRSEFDFWEQTEDWPADCVEIAAMILDNPDYFLGETPNLRRRDSTPLQRVKDELAARGRSPKRVSITIRQMHQAVNQI